MTKEILKTLLVQLGLPIVLISLLTAGVVTYHLRKEKEARELKQMREVPVRVAPNTV